MRITKLRLDNFRSFHGRNEVNGLERISVFLGLNGVGKSTVLDAVCFALTGACRGTDQGGRGAERLVSRRPDGQPASDGFQVVLETDKGEIARTLGAGPNSKYQETVNRLVGPRKGRNTLAVQVALQPHVFLSLMPSEQKALLLSVVGAEIDQAQVKAQLGELARHLPPGALDSLQMLDAVERTLRDRRPQIKRAIDELVVPTPPELEVNVPEGMTPEQAVKEARVQIAEMRSEREGILSAVRARQAAAAAVHKTRSGLETRITQIRSQLGRIMPEEELCARIKELATSLEKVSEKSKAADAERLKAEGRSAAARAISDAMSVLLEGDEGRAALCPTCLPKLRELQKSYDKEAAGFARKAKTMPPAASVKKVEEELDVLYRAGDQLQDLKRELASAEAQLAELRKGEAPPESDAQAEARAKDLEAAVAKGESYVQRLQRVVFAGEQAEKIRARRAELESDLAQVEALVKRIGPGGDVRAALLGPRLTELEAEVNALLERAGWGRAEMRLDGPTFVLRHAPGASRLALEPEMLSASEHYRLSLAVAAAVARRAGLGLLCLDGAEVLVGDNKAALAEVLDAAGLEQALVCASTAAAPPSEAPEGWAFYEVKKDNGRSAVRPAAVASAA